MQSKLLLLCSLVSVAAAATPRCQGKLLREQIEVKQEETLRLLRDKQYGDLQAHMDGLLQAYAKGKLTDEELSFEFHAFDRWAPWLTPLFHEWLAKFPDSYAGTQGMAMHLSAVAWSKRGQSSAADTSDQQMEQFEKSLRSAQDWATRAIPLFKKPIVSYELLLNNSTALSDARPYGPRLLKESLSVEPDNVIVRQAFIHFLDPRWGGSNEAIEAFAQRSVHPNLPQDRFDSVVYSAHLQMGNNLFVDKKYERAVEQYKEAAKSCQLNAPWVKISELRIVQEKYSEALEAAEAALKVTPDGQEALKYKAESLNGLKRFNEAYPLLLRLAPQGDPVVLVILGEYYGLGQGGAPRNIDEARRLFLASSKAGNKRAVWDLQKLETDPYFKKN
jgi:tetratricopeptide (TPR) repeat protein